MAGGAARAAYSVVLEAKKEVKKELEVKKEVKKEVVRVVELAVLTVEAGQLGARAAVRGRPIRM